MNPIKLSNSMAKGLLKMAAKNDVRFYLNGVFVDVEAGVLVASDGHVMGICRPEYMDKEGANFIIPRTALESAVKLKGDIFVHESDGKYRLEVGDVAIGFTPVEGRFIEWRKVVPHETSGETGQYNPQLLARAHDFLNLCTDMRMSVPFLHHNGMSAALMTVHGSNVLAIIMPWRAGHEDCVFLDSLIGPKQAAA